MLAPVVVSRNDLEQVLVEPSINSVRVSIKIKQKDDLEIILVHKFSQFLMQRAEQFLIMRRKAVEVRGDVEEKWRWQIISKLLLVTGTACCCLWVVVFAAFWLCLPSCLLAVLDGCVIVLSFNFCWHCSSDW